MVDDFRIDVAGIVVEGGGEIRSGGGLNATVDLAVDDLKAFKTMIADWAPDTGPVGDNSGPISGHVVVTGTLTDPRYEAEIEWVEPVIADRGLVGIGVDLQGNISRTAFSAKITADEGT